MCVDLFSRAFVWPRGGGGHDGFAAIKEGRMKQRLEEINTTIKTQNFYDWLAEQKEHSTKTFSASDSLW
jgi:E3 ubiquitin-protein ligase RHA2